MSEEAIFPFRAIFSLISIGALAVVIVIFVWLFINTIIKVHENELDRAAFHVRDVIVTGKLTTALAVFNRTELDKYHPPGGEPSIDEPYARHCKYGYRLEIETLTDVDEKKGRWEFGYKPDSHLDISTVDSYVSIYDDAEGSVIPAKMKLTLYDTLLTRISCIVEKAYRSGKTQAMPLPCAEREKCKDTWAGLCAYTTIKCEALALNIEEIDNRICKDQNDCRYMTEAISLGPFEKEIEEINKDIAKEIVIKAVPLKSETGAETSDCSLISNALIATGTEDTEIIALCVEGLQ